jgi:uncharacterized protein
VSAPTKRCQVAYATCDRQQLWTVELPFGACVADAIDAARQAALVQGTAHLDEVPWDSAPVGIFGEPCQRSSVPRDGDRIEIYRPLPRDPRERRRARLLRARKPA